MYRSASLFVFLITLLCLPRTGTAASFEADFDSLPLDVSQYWAGEDLSGGFTDDWMRFGNQYTSYSWGFTWSGFAYSSITDTNTAGFGNQFAVWTPGTGVAGGDSYAIVNTPGSQDTVTFAFPGCARGFYVNNTTYTALSMLNGDAFAKKFGGPSGDDPDWLLLTISGWDTTGSLIHTQAVYLADYRFTNNAQDYVVSDWTWVDLTHFGSEVKELTFDLTSTDNGTFGMNTPAYFAMDELRYAAAPSSVNVDFEDQGLSTNEFDNGSDLSGNLISRFVTLKNNYNEDFDSWQGFSASTVMDTNTAGFGNQYAVWTPGTGQNSSPTYGIGNTYGNADILLGGEAQVDGFYVNNTTYAALSMLNGDFFAKQFGGASGDDPDWFLLTVEGFDEDESSLGTEEFYLADYRFTNNALDYIVGDWTWMDLSSFGSAVRKLSFDLSSSDVGSFGINTPAYFALDNLTLSYTYSSADGASVFDGAVPGFTGIDGDGVVSTNNPVNAAFAGWAVEVVEYAPASPGDIAVDWTNAMKSLGPVTADNFDVVSLGELDTQQVANSVSPGSITLRLDPPAMDRPGPDIAVFENALAPSATEIFGELAFVEVSSDGTNFVRFPSMVLHTNAVGPYETLMATDIYNLAGKHINGSGGSWATPFDLSDFACSTAVSNGTLDLNHVPYVRIVDIPGTGDFFDSSTPPRPIYDPHETFGSGGFDLEAVGVLNGVGYDHIETDVTGPGLILPYGQPDGAVAVASGSNVTFQIDPTPGFYRIDTRVDGQSVGAITTYTFSNVTSAARIQSDFGSRLIIESAYGTGTPSVGTNLAYGPVTASMTGFPVTVGATQYVFTGWTATGSAPTSGVAPQVSFNLTNDTTIRWDWSTNYWLEVQADGEGTVQPGSLWAEQGTVVTSTATANPWFEFIGWTGNPEGDTNLTVATTTMNGPRALTAVFGGETTSQGVPLTWMEAYSLTNNTPEQEATTDQDGDGDDAWIEFFAGNDPNDSNSVFRIIESGASNGMAYVTWIGGTNGSIHPFRVLGTDRLDGSWQVLDGQVSRSASGTNTWSSTSATQQYFSIDVAP